MGTRSVVPIPELKLDAEKTPTETIVRCTGRITAETATTFQDAIRSLIRESRCILVDLSHVNCIDSAGLGALVSVWSSAKKKSAEVGFQWSEALGSASRSELKLIDLSGHIKRLFRLTTGWITSFIATRQV